MPGNLARFLVKHGTLFGMFFITELRFSALAALGKMPLLAAQAAVEAGISPWLILTRVLMVIWLTWASLEFFFGIRGGRLLMDR